MQVHIWPSRTRSVAAANAAISVHASCVASCVGTGTVWKWSKTQIDSKGPSSRSASSAMPSMVCQWSLVSMPTRSSRHPCGTKSPKRISHHPTRSVRRRSARPGRTVPAGPPGAGSGEAAAEPPGRERRQREGQGGEQAEFGPLEGPVAAGRLVDQGLVEGGGELRRAGADGRLQAALAKLGPYELRALLA